MSLSINTLFGSFNNSSANSSFTSGLYSSLSEYSTIRSGAYKKLVSSYYSKTRMPLHRRESLQRSGMQQTVSTRLQASLLTQAPPRAFSRKLIR